MSGPLISIITASYNSESFIQNCIDSVRNQTYAKVEHILIDGDSVDGTAEIIRRSSEKEDTRIAFWDSEPDGGVYHAFNKGLKRVRGEWVCFLGSDDEFSADDSLERVARELKRVPSGVFFAYGSVNLVNESGKVLSVLGNADWCETRKQIFEQSSILLPSYHQGIFCRAEAFRTYGEFDTSFKISADIDQFLRVISYAPDCHHMNLQIANMLWGGLSSSKQNLHLLFMEAIRIHVRYGLPRAKTPKAFVKRGVVEILRFLPEKLLATLLNAYLSIFSDQYLKK